MALTPSRMIPLGTQAPNFSLTEVVTGQTISLKSFEGKKVFLVMFICQHCPYVQHVKHELALLGKDYFSKSVGIVAISSNDQNQYPDDAPSHLKKMAEELKFTFPFCHDSDQEIAKAYSASCTPDFFLFNEKRQLVYRGQLDESRPENGKPVTGVDLRSAIDAVLKDLPVHPHQKPSLGCNVKWRKGKEPIYSGK